MCIRIRSDPTITCTQLYPYERLMSTSKRLSRQILEIDEVTTGNSSCGQTRRLLPLKEYHRLNRKINSENITSDPAGSKNMNSGGHVIAQETLYQLSEHHQEESCQSQTLYQRRGGLVCMGRERRRAARLRPLSRM
jgi:hypothetical protein